VYDKLVSFLPSNIFLLIWDPSAERRERRAAARRRGEHAALGAGSGDKHRSLSLQFSPPPHRLEQVLWLWWAVSWLNDDVEGSREERDERLAVSFQPAWAQEPKISTRATNTSYLKCEGLNHYTSRLRGGL
jgi:hypothetical protein